MAKNKALDKAKAQKAKSANLAKSVASAKTSPKSSSKAASKKATSKIGAKTPATKTLSKQKIGSKSASKIATKTATKNSSTKNLASKSSKNTAKSAVKKEGAQEKVLSKKVRQRQERVKQAALELFLSKGYENTNLKDIIQISGGSLSSIYDDWGNKEQLFFDILSDKIKQDKEELMSSLSKKKDKSLKEFLELIAATLVRIFNQKETVALTKITYQQFFNSPKNCLLWMQESKEFFIESLVVERFRKENAFLKNNAERLSKMFCSLLTKYCFDQNVFLNKPLMKQKEQAEYAEFVVKLFLKAVL